MQISTPRKIAFIGFGEAAQAFCEGFSPLHSGALHAFDKKTDIAKTRHAKRDDYIVAKINGHETAADCVAKADIIFSMVTADQAINAAKSVAKVIAPQTLYFDCNSIAPNTKRAIASIIESAGGRYVDVALMGPVHPNLHRVPILVSGPHADAALAAMTTLDMNAAQIDGDIGSASSIKMVRSIMVKGLEALMAECTLAGRAAGVEDIVLETLEETFPGFGWKTRTAYALDRMIEHGPRRAAEMAEVAQTVADLGLDNPMSRATVRWQQSIGDLNLEPLNSTHSAGADAILLALAPKPETKP